MKKLMFLVLMFVSFSLYAEKCRYAENKKDEFTKARILSVYAKDAEMTIGYRKVNDKYYLELIYVRSGAYSMVVPSNSTLMLMLGNDSILNLYTTEIFSADIDYIYNSNVTTLKVSIPIKKTEIDTINKQWIKKWRLYLTDSYIEKEISNEGLFKIQAASRCILEEVPVGTMKIEIEEENPPFEIERSIGSRW